MNCLPSPILALMDRQLCGVGSLQKLIVHGTLFAGAKAAFMACPLRRAGSPPERIAASRCSSLRTTFAVTARRRPAPST